MGGTGSGSHCCHFCFVIVGAAVYYRQGIRPADDHASKPAVTVTVTHKVNNGFPIFLYAAKVVLVFVFGQYLTALPDCLLLYILIRWFVCV